MTDRFERSRVAVAAGDGVVARFPGVVCVARPGSHAALPELLEHCAKAAGADPGRALARRLAGWLSGPDAPGEDLVFGTVSVAGDRLAVFLNGGVTAHVADGGPSLSGANAAAWTDQLIEFADAPLVLAPEGVAVPASLLDLVHDLAAGVVPGAAAVLAPSGQGRLVSSPPAGSASAAPSPGPAAAAPAAAKPAVAEPAVAEPAVAEPGVADAPAAAAPAVAPAVATPSVSPAGAEGEATVQGLAPVQVPEPVAAPAPAVQLGVVAEPRAPRRAESLAGAPEDEPTGTEEPRRPLEAGVPVGGHPPAQPKTVASDTGGAVEDPGAASEPAVPQTRGHLCSRGHLNDPRSHFCVLCGIRMNERTGVLVLGPRPPLGLLVFDNGATYSVDAEYLVGRTPDADERVRGGSLRPLPVEDREGAVSRVHAEVRVRGWDVVLVDSGSRNGTYVVPPGEQAWSQVPPGRSHRLAPGTRVRLGSQRTFVFESPSGVR